MSDEVSAEKRLRLVNELISAAGTEGMVGGQVADMEAENRQVTLEELNPFMNGKLPSSLAFV